MKAQEVNRKLTQYVDVMIGNEDDFTACLGFKVEGAHHIRIFCNQMKSWQ